MFCHLRWSLFLPTPNPQHLPESPPGYLKLFLSCPGYYLQVSPLEIPWSLIFLEQPHFKYLILFSEFIRPCVSISGLKNTLSVLTFPLPWKKSSRTRSQSNQPSSSDWPSRLVQERRHSLKALIILFPYKHPAAGEHHLHATNEDTEAQKCGKWQS